MRNTQFLQRDAEQAYQEWTGAWGVDLEEVDITVSDEVADVPLDVVEALWDLLDRP